MKASTGSKKAKETTAFEGKDKDGNSVVGIGNMRVIIVEDDGAWFAQGLEIDYAVQGTSIADAKKQFEDGLTATVHEHLKMFGTIEKLLKVAPQEVWTEMVSGVFTHKRSYRYSQSSVHGFKKSLKESLPFKGIQYLTPVEEGERACA